MLFQTRNTYYLRISASAILPLYVYLDERHVSWMSDYILQRLLEDLRPRIIPKLRAEANVYIGPGNAPASAKRGTVDVHRGDIYQFAFFFRYTEPHSVLIKQRNFVFAPEPPPDILPKSMFTQEQPRSKKRARRSEKHNKQKPSTTVPAGDDNDDDETAPLGAEEVGVDVGSSYNGLRRSGRRKTARNYMESDEQGEHEQQGRLHGSVDEDDPDFIGLQIDPDMVIDQDEVAEFKEGSQDISVRSAPGPDIGAGEPSRTQADQRMTFDVDEEEPKPKLAVELRYQGFSLSGRCLCVVVEPWPPLRGATPARRQTPVTVGTASVQTSSVALGPVYARAKTPLFYPDDDDGPRATPALSHTGLRVLPPVPLFDEPAEDDRDDDGEGMMQFSQVLNVTSSVMRSGMEDDDEFEGAVLFADADEAREF
ncbi:hypothetical protein K488DRAFT_40519 [Vararia minispora EC-137]|uniref:Uncharacterized protein n=1 Tax=Vararia minispora EC-137 TaxID=1314806 RepID=A0ACB8QYN1_9AGAM|nr:hypothetical protein K488DRAFT_40519 [Vararia minispora EC-137]